MPTICKSTFESTMFLAIFSAAFFGYFRMGELVHNSVHDSGHAIQYGDVTYLAHYNTVHIFLRHSKTDQEGKGSSISLTPTLLPICPGVRQPIIQTSFVPHWGSIGAASVAWVLGTSAQDIASKGRWKSHCMFKYIRN